MDENNFVGADVNIPVKTRKDFSLFSESQSRIIVSINPKNKNEFEKILNDSKQIFTYLGRTGGKNLKVNDEINVSLDEIAEKYYLTIPRIMND